MLNLKFTRKRKAGQKGPTAPWTAPGREGTTELTSRLAVTLCNVCTPRFRNAHPAALPVALDGGQAKAQAPLPGEGMQLKAGAVSMQSLVQNPSSVQVAWAWRTQPLTSLGLSFPICDMEEA